MRMVVPRDQSSFVLGSVHRAKRLFPAEKSCALDALRYLAFSILLLQVVQCRDCFGVCTYCILHNRTLLQAGALGRLPQESNSLATLRPACQRYSVYSFLTN